MAAGRAAGDDHEVRIGAVLGAVLADPLDRALAVDQMVGERGTRAETVVGADADPAARREVAHERNALLVLAAQNPGAAVDLEERRTARHLGSRTVDVERERLLVDAVVDDVAHPFDAGMPHGQRQEDLPPVDRRRELLADLGKDLLAVGPPEPVAQRLLDDGLGTARYAIALREPGPRRERDGEPDDPRPGRERAGPYEHGGQQQLPHEVVKGQLGSEPPREEARDRAPRGSMVGPQCIVGEPCADEAPAAEEPGRCTRGDHSRPPCHVRARG